MTLSPATRRTILRTAMVEQHIFSAFQPVVDLKTGVLFAHEALARCRTDAFKNPMVMFHAAIEEKCVGELGRLLRHAAIKGCPAVPLFLNVNPNEFDEGWLVQPDDPIFWHDHPVYLEITESVPISHFAYCNSVLKEVRSKGVRIVIDDLGSGYSNLKYIADLEPEIIKLDRELVAGVTQGSRQYRLIKNTIALCHDFGAKVVAEGIETTTELNAVIEAEADFGQGYLIARPAYPAPNYVWPPKAQG